VASAAHQTGSTTDAPGQADRRIAAIMPPHRSPVAVVVLVVAAGLVAGAVGMRVGRRADGRSL